MTSVQVLRKARNFLIRHKWGKGEYHNPDNNSYCAIGALRAVAPKHEDREDSWYYLDQAAMKYDKDKNIYRASMIWFNDQASTRKKDVIKVYDEAIALAQASEVN